MFNFCYDCKHETMKFYQLIDEDDGCGLKLCHVQACGSCGAVEFQQAGI